MMRPSVRRRGDRVRAVPDPARGAGRRRCRAGACGRGRVDELLGRHRRPSWGRAARRRPAPPAGPTAGEAPAAARAARWRSRWRWWARSPSLVAWAVSASRWARRTSPHARHGPGSRQSGRPQTGPQPGSGAGGGGGGGGGGGAGGGGPTLVEGGAVAVRGRARPVVTSVVPTGSFVLSYWATPRRRLSSSETSPFSCEASPFRGEGDAWASPLWIDAGGWASPFSCEASPFCAPTASRASPFSCEASPFCAPTASRASPSPRGRDEPRRHPHPSGTGNAGSL